MHLTLFFTQHVSLRVWDESGMFNRETALYHRLVSKGVRVTFVTYGLADDLDYARQLPGIQILCNRKGRSPERYAAWLRWLFARTLWRTSVIKTNQFKGGDIALAAAQWWRKPLIVRGGYMWSDFAKQEHPPDVAAHIVQQEQQLFGAAHHIVVTTPMMKEQIIAQNPQLTTRLSVIPNYVDTDLFVPNPTPPEIDLLFVGRLHPQKNLEALLTAVAALDGVTLRVIGSGPLQDELHQTFGTLDGRVQWLGNQPNHDLPHHINVCRLFVLPSLYEGHPKTLIEAMACGKAVLGAKSKGIQEIIQHGQTGWLCPPTAAGLQEAIVYLLQNDGLRDDLGQSARAYAVQNFALDHIVDQELAILKKVVL